jgi:hypothetical protein
VAAGIVVLAAVGIMLGVVLTGSSKSNAVPKGALPHAAYVQRILDGIHHDKNVLGSASGHARFVSRPAHRAGRSRRCASLTAKTGLSASPTSRDSGYPLSEDL